MGRETCLEHIRSYGLQPTSRTVQMAAIPEKQLKLIKNSVRGMRKEVKKAGYPHIFKGSVIIYLQDLKRYPRLSQRGLFALRQLVSLVEFGDRPRKARAIEFLNGVMALDPENELENLVHVLTLDDEVMFASTDVAPVNSWANLLTHKTSVDRVKVTPVKLNEVSEDLRSYMDGYKPKRTTGKKGKR